MYSTRPAFGRAASFFRVSISRRVSAVSKWSFPCTWVRSSRISRTGPCASSYFPIRPKARALAYSSLTRCSSALESSRRGAAGLGSPRATRVSAEAASANQRQPPGGKRKRRVRVGPSLTFPARCRSRGRGVLEETLICNSPAPGSLLAVGHGEGDHLNRLELGAALEELTQFPQRLRHVFLPLKPSPIHGPPGELASVEVPAPGPAHFDSRAGGVGCVASLLVGREGFV